MLSRMDLKQWNEVSNSGIWNEPFAENSVLPSLKLSYIAMPPVDVGCGPNHIPERALDARAATDWRTQQDITFSW
jgi:hypothetical protein